MLTLHEVAEILAPDRDNLYNNMEKFININLAAHPHIGIKFKEPHQFAFFMVSVYENCLAPTNDSNKGEFNRRINIGAAKVEECFQAWLKDDTNFIVELLRSFDLYTDNIERVYWEN